MKLPQVGVELVVRGQAAFTAALERANEAIRTAGDAAQSTARKASALDDALGKLRTKFAGIADVFTDGGGKLKTVDGALTALFNRLPVGTAAFAALGAAAAGTFLELGRRGAAIEGLTDAFTKLNAQVGITALEQLTALRKAAAGTISDIELIRLANVALAGATGEAGRAFAAALPRILEIARAQARATGQDVNFLFESLITGVKRGSPLLIDNTGLVLKLGEANAAYAASLGVTVEQLTAEQQQIALLNALLEAGQAPLALYGGGALTAAERLAQMGASLDNLANTFAAAVQPAFSIVLDITNRFIGVLAGVASAIAPLVGSILELGAAIANSILSPILSVLEPLGRFASVLIQIVTAVLQPVINAFTMFFRFIADGFQRIVDFVGQFVETNLGLNFDTLAYNFGRGAGFVFGAFLSAAAAVGTQIVAFVADLAQAIADFLVGQSPPPKGALSRIDEGGAATFRAWLEGFASVGIQPVEDVAQAVAQQLGDVASMSLEQVEARLAQLDRAIQPFRNQLEIVRANFEAISAPAQAALNAIERQTAQALKALARGDSAAAETLRLLDAQRERIVETLDAQQALVDQATIQLSLAEAQQAQERALLNIRKQQLPVVKQTAELASRVPGVPAAPSAPGAMPRLRGAGGGASALGIGAAPALTLPTDAAPGIGLISGQQTQNQVAADISAGFDTAFGLITSSALGDFDAAVADLSTQTQRIVGADVGARFGTLFSGVFTGFSDTVVNPLTNFFTGTGEGTLNGILTSASALLSGAIDTYIIAPFSSVTQGISSFFSAFFTGTDSDTLNGILSNIDITTAIDTYLVTPFTDAVSGVATSISTFFTGTGEGTLSAFLQSGIDFFTNFVSTIGRELGALPGVFFAMIATPFVQAINTLIESVETIINGVFDTLAGAFSNLRGVFELTNSLDAFNQIMAGLQGGIRIPRVPMPAPPTVPAAASGGVFSGGLVRVGERGEELVASGASRLGIFPNTFVRALEGLTDALTAPYALAGGGVTHNTTTYDYSLNPTYNMGGGMPSASERQRLMVMRMMRR